MRLRRIRITLLLLLEEFLLIKNYLLSVKQKQILSKREMLQ